MADQINIDDFLDFLKNSPTPFHAVAQMKLRLENSGFQQLDEAQSWTLKAGKKYWLTRNDSSIIAFVMPNKSVIDNGLVMIGAHTDSPCLKLKPMPEKHQEGYYQTLVEVYGGALLNPWFDRDLSLAGRITYSDKNNKLNDVLIDFKKPIATIPSLAIHLDSQANKNRTINAQLHLPPVLFQHSEKPKAFREMLKTWITKFKLAKNIKSILDFDLLYYDTQSPSIIGLDQEFIASARLDNLLSCYVGLNAIEKSNPKMGSLLVCTDHEEVGSRSASGADGPFLEQVLRRISSSDEDKMRLIHNSTLISVDNAHGVHPNYADKHDPEHKPLINHGPVIKVNANQRYATNSHTAGWFRHICEKNNIPLQTIAVRSDMRCGSTIGPITASRLGIKTLDVGVCQLAMHSIRELAGVNDLQHLYQALLSAINNRD